VLDIYSTALLLQCSFKIAAGWWFSPSTLVFSTDKTDNHDITEILLKSALNTITLTTLMKNNGHLKLVFWFEDPWSSCYYTQQTNIILLQCHRSHNIILNRPTSSHFNAIDPTIWSRRQVFCLYNIKSGSNLE
jgi:hypothetical protein